MLGPSRGKGIGMLPRPENSHHKYHISTKFARASIRYLGEIASFLGPEEVTFHSQDDKAKVPIGIPAAKKHVPLLMHLEYKVQLPDHDFVVAANHKLIPSVIGDMQVMPRKLTGDAVSYNDPTYIAIRSAKHTGSSAFHHLIDMKRIRSLPEFEPSFKNSKNSKKPVMIITVDGGPDENTRYSNTIACAIDYFVSEELDALFIATNAPGRSAFNRCERRMSPLSKELSGVILEYEHFGNHLDQNGKTVDPELELKNFEHAGEVLAEIWSGLVINGHLVVSEYIKHNTPPMPINKPEEWKAGHMRQSQYFLQIIKCHDENCCTPFRSSYMSIVRDRFLPPPLAVIQGKDGLQWATIPYDLACPSLDDSELKKRICGECDIYFGSIKEMTSHKRMCKRRFVDLHTTTEEPRIAKVRPKRIAATRQKEYLCAQEYQDLEWLAFDEVDTTGLEVPEEVGPTSGTPILPENCDLDINEVGDD